MNGLSRIGSFLLFIQIALFYSICLLFFVFREEILNGKYEFFFFAAMYLTGFGGVLAPIVLFIMWITERTKK